MGAYPAVLRLRLMHLKAVSCVSLLKQAGEGVEPGSVVWRDEGSMVVICGDGPLRILEMATL